MAKTEPRQKIFGPQVRPIGLVGLTPVVALAAMGINMLILGQSKPVYTIIWMVSCVGGWIAWVMWPDFRLRPALKPHGRFICLPCFYPLEGLPDSGICPEGAEPYTRQDLARLWRMWEVTANKGKPIVKD